MNRWYYAKKWFPIFPGFIRPVSAPFLHDHYLVRSAERSLIRVFVDGIVCVGFLLWVPLRARTIAHRFGLDRGWASKASGIGRRRFVDPMEIAVFRMEADGDADRFMRRFEYSDISKRINPPAWTHECVLADKVHFADRCSRHLLPTPTILARAIPGAIAVNALPTSEIVAIKPTGGVGGSGFELASLPRREWTTDSFKAWLRDRMRHRHGDWIVQPKIDGHEGLRDLALNALSTVRITTMQNEHGRTEIVTAAFRFAGNPEAMVDNLAAGGLLAPVDMESGRLGCACNGRRPGDVRHHPVTGAQIEGRTLPFWSKTRELVLRAHREGFAEYVMIGWDVGITGRGPILIEGNGKPGLFAAQQAGRIGVGESRLGALIAFHLAEAQRRRSRSGRSFTGRGESPESHHQVA
jgi:hypothetical protein